ncbi:hypothetical protein BDW59DRAFT_5943 [Aspergillus cavernicola]|uniref:FHA domain-containing protein n=1 Tax=Aspergillus cavernicola TaxID=176166 RepID=A0ABR4J5E9_9EURO
MHGRADSRITITLAPATSVAISCLRHSQVCHERTGVLNSGDAFYVGVADTLDCLNYEQLCMCIKTGEFSGTISRVHLLLFYKQKKLVSDI